MFSFIKSLFKTTKEICFLQKGPEDIPGSRGLLQGVALLSICVTWLALFPLKGPTIAAINAVLNVVIMLIFTRAMLIIAKKKERFIQTGTALLLTNLFISLLGLVFLLLLYGLRVLLGDMANVLYSLGLSFIFLWILTVQGHIFRQAMEKTLLVGVLLAFLLMFFNAAVLELINRSLGLFVGK